MEFKLHRVAPNSEGWVRPSAGRLGAKSVGRYVEEHGFGHEDWNFNFSFASEGEMFGYTVARPAEEFRGQEFGVILATYGPSGWKAVGYYRGARFKNPGEPPEAALDQMANDVLKLAKEKSVSPEYRGKTLANLKRLLRNELQYYCWKIPYNNVFVFKEPVAIPTHFFAPGVQRMTISYNITEDEFHQIIKLGDTVRTPGPVDGRIRSQFPENIDAIDDLGTDAPSSVAVSGLRYARDPKIRKAVKLRARGKCEFCGEPGFKCVDGSIYLECHHIIALANDGADRMTNVIALCPRDHREAHFGERLAEIEKEMMRKVMLAEGISASVVV